MRQNIHDITIVSKKVGIPDVFLAVTCNLQWPGIKIELPPGQIVAYRLDISACVSCIELRALIENIIDEKVFGDAMA